MSVTIISFPKYSDNNGVLCVFEAGRHVPFEIRRVFTVSAMSGDIRGDHAHRKCSQLLVCLKGKIHVICDSGHEVSRHLLDGVERGLLIPPGIWARQDYLTDDAVMMVLCDRAYEEGDYIRDYDEFKTIAGT
jgi:dTDP-4-dehydrorhamnose 3,5-epimerase-like enzyme